MIDRGHTIFFTGAECDLVRRADVQLGADSAVNVEQRLRFYQAITCVMTAELFTADLADRRRARNHLMQTAQTILEKQ